MSTRQDISMELHFTDLCRTSNTILHQLSSPLHGWRPICPAPIASVGPRLRPFPSSSRRYCQHILAMPCIQHVFYPFLLARLDMRSLWRDEATTACPQGPLANLQERTPPYVLNGMHRLHCQRHLLNHTFLREKWSSPRFREGGLES
jgi:hypothetical protein